MGMDSHSPLCDIRKLVCVIIPVAALVLLIQFLSVPYGSVLLSILPSEKFPLRVQSENSASDSSPAAEVVFGISLLNASAASNSSSLGEDAGNDSNGKETDRNSGDGEDFELGIEILPEETVELSHNSSVSREIREPVHDLPSENVSFDNGQKEKILTIGRTQSEDSSSTSDAPAVLPVGSSSIRAPVDADLNISVISADSNMSSLGEGATNTLSEDKTPEILENNRGTSQSNLTLSSVSPVNISVISADSNMSSLGEGATNMLSEDKTPEILENNRGTSQSNLTLSSVSPVKDKSDVPAGGGNSTNKPIHTNSLGKQTGRGTSQNDPNMAANSGKMELPSTPVKTIADMYFLLLESRTSSRSMIPRWPSVRDQEILSAKSQIENPPPLKKDKTLYAPLFRNVSMFRRSYELMEQTLKVYTYKEGAQPIFHRPETKGIYASEGWFMKQMEGNRQFSVKDPRKAHLFYLPFSARRLEQFLYIPNSHSHMNLVAYLKSYLDLISAKYPFWNRTGGADHFLVGCHDWAPAETRQYMNTCIRALCNADVSVDFAIGKDVSLPETNVRRATDPVRDLGGKPVSNRQILAFFAGSMHGYLRPILLKYWENKDPDMKIYGHMGRGNKNKASYVQHMKNSKYCICAKGFEVNSPRVVEAIFYECVPVILSDNFVPPFFEVLNWEAFAIFVPEKDIPDLKNILLSISPEKYLKLQMNVRRVQQHFLWHTKPVKYDIFHMILHSVWYSRVYQINVA